MNILFAFSLVLLVAGQLPPSPNPIYKTPTSASAGVDQEVYLASTSKLFVVNHLLAANKVDPDTKFSASLVLKGLPIVLGIYRGSVIINNKGDYNLEGITTSVTPDGPPHVVANTLGNATLSTLDPLAGVKTFAKKLASKVRIWKGSLQFEQAFSVQDTPIDGPIYPLVINDNLIDVLFKPSGVELHPKIPGYTLKSNVTNCKGCTSSVSTYLDPNDDYTIIATGQFNPEDYLLILTVEIVDPVEVFTRVFYAELKRLGVIHIKENSVDCNCKTHIRRTVYTLPTKPYSEVMKGILKVSNNLQSNYLHLVLYNTFEAAAQALNSYYRSQYPNWVDFLSFSGNNNLERPSLIYQFLVDLKTKSYFTSIYNANPTLGVDGTLAGEPVPPVLVGKVTGKSGSYAETDATETYILLSEGFGGYIKDNNNELLPFYIVYPQQYLLTIEEYVNKPTELYTQLLLVEEKVFNLAAQLFFPSA